MCRPPFGSEDPGGLFFFWNFHYIVRRGRGPPAGEEQRCHAADERDHAAYWWLGRPYC